MRRIGAVLCVLLVGAHVRTLTATDHKLYPVDEWSVEPSLAKMRTKLRESVRLKSWESLRGSLDPAIENSFGGNGGIAEFEQFWHPERASSRLWPILNELLRLGGCFVAAERSEFYTPYVFGRFPHELDAFKYVVVIGSGADLRARPSRKARAIATLEYDIVELLNSPGESDTWVYVRTRNLNGYVERNSVRSPIDYRLGLRKIGQTWRIVALIAGD